MNRRYFLQAIGIGVACLALRIKPDTAKELPKLDDRVFSQADFDKALERIYRVTSPGPQLIYYSEETYRALMKINFKP